jgi:DNA-directed RNA polymerase specialized sigma24 family protein
LENLSYKEISKRTGLSENTLFSRKRYAIQYLRKQLLSLYQEL